MRKKRKDSFEALIFLGGEEKGKEFIMRLPLLSMRGGMEQRGPRAGEGAEPGIPDWLITTVVLREV